MRHKFLYLKCKFQREQFRKDENDNLEKLEVTGKLGRKKAAARCVGRTRSALPSIPPFMNRVAKVGRDGVPS